MPTPLVELPWGSRSTSRMMRPREARAADRLTAVLVFPTPPFWLTIANVFPVGCDPISVYGFYGCDDEGPIGRNRAPVLSHDIEILHSLSGELPGGGVLRLCRTPESEKSQTGPRDSPRPCQRWGRQPGLP